jgi:glycosyltransferase involved in cell wall biosynthesis
VRIVLDIRRSMSDFGVATYLRNIVRTLGRVDHKNEYILLGNVEKLARESGQLPPNFTLLPFHSGDVTPRVYMEFRRTIKHLGCDLIHVPHTFWRPLPVSCPYIMTVHDLLDYMYRAKTRSGLGRVAHFYLTRQVMQRAARLFAVSNFTKQDLQRFFQISPSKIEVVYNALDENLALGHTTPEERQTIVERYQVNNPFILYAGRISPHKNVTRIIEAFSALKTELAKDGRLPDLKLIIIGDEVSKHLDLRRAVIRGGVQNDVRFLGFVPIDVLRIFYDTAKVFVFPSLYEGFGLPPLEAMAHGTPVITSNTSALPEVVGTAALLVNPENVFEISRAMYRALTEPELRERLKEAGKRQAERFSWENSVRQIVTAYEEIASNKSRSSVPK